MPKKKGVGRGSGCPRQPGRKRRSFKEKQNWVPDRLDKKWEFVLKTTVNGHYAPHISPSEEDDEEAWHKEFSEGIENITLWETMFLQTLQRRLG